MRLKYAVNESTLSTAGAVPLPRVGKAKRRGLRRKKGSQPRLAALGSSFQGKGLAWTTHSFLWKEVPRRGGGWMGESGIPETKPSPRGEGGERSEPDRVLAV